MAEHLRWEISGSGYFFGSGLAMVWYFVGMLFKLFEYILESVEEHLGARKILRMFGMVCVWFHSIWKVQFPGEFQVCSGCMDADLLSRVGDFCSNVNAQR